MNVLLLPGLMCNEVSFQPLYDHWAGRGVRTLCADYGDADSIVMMAQRALAQAHSAWGTEPFAIVGHSMGGRVAQEMVRKHLTATPPAITKAVFMSTGCTPVAADEVGKKEIAGRMNLLSIAQTQGVAAMAAEWVKPMVAPSRLSDQALVGSIVEMIASKTAARFEQQLRALITRADTSSVLAALKLPTLLVCSEFDGWANVAQHEAMLALCTSHHPPARLAVVAGAGHMLTMESPAATAKVLLDFLAA